MYESRGRGRIIKGNGSYVFIEFYTTTTQPPWESESYLYHGHLAPRKAVPVPR